MSVEVKLFANFREAAGKKRIEVTAETIDDLLRKISCKYPDLGDEIFVDKQTRELKEYLNISVNGQIVKDLDGSSLELKSEDSVLIFPPVSGG